MNRFSPTISPCTAACDDSRVLDVIPTGYNPSSNHHTGDSTQRLVIQQQFDAAGPQLVLVQESFAADVGWFSQSRVVIQADQLAALKTLFTGRAVTKLVRQQVALEANESEAAVFAFPQAS